MNVLKLQSPLAVDIQNFITLRRLSGTDYQSQAQLLGYFDRFLVEQQLREPHITQEITERYIESLSHLAPRTRSNRFCVVKQLCEYLSRSDTLGYIPEPFRVIPSKGAHQPYIYNNSELQAPYWRPHPNCRQKTPFGLTPTALFWDSYRAQESASARPWP